MGGWTCFPGVRKICCRCSEEILDDRLQTYVDTHDHQLGEASCFRGRVGGPYLISSVDWFVNVFGQHQTRYEFCSEHSQSVHGGAQESALGSYKTYFEIPCWDCRLWSRLQEARWSGLGWLHGFKLGRQCFKPEEHFQLLFQGGLDSCVVVQSKEKVCCFESCKGQVHGNQSG